MSASTEERQREGRAMRAFILGTFLGTIGQKDYPVKVRGVEEWFDDDDNIQAISMITESGFRFRINVEFEGEEPT